MVACGMHYGVWLKDHGVDITKYFGNTAYISYGKWDLPEKFHSDKWISEVATRAIEECKYKGRPFFLSINFQDPHNPCMVPEPWDKMYKPDKIPVFSFKEGEPESFNSKPPFYNEIINNKGSYRWRSSDPDLPGPANVSSLDWTAQQVQENAACYYGMVSLMDKYVGIILDKLEELNLINNTIIVFTADHGDYLGDPGMFWKSLVAFEEDVNVPLIVSYPKVLPRRKTSTALHNLVDLAPTFLSLIGFSIPNEMEGIEQSKTWIQPNKSTRTFTVIEERPYNSEFNVRVLINENHKICLYANKKYGELYDIKQDPDHVNNLWQDPEYQLTSWMMNKTKPRLSHAEELISNIPESVRKKSLFFTTIGKFLMNDGKPSLQVAFPVMSKNMIKIPLIEVLEDLIGEEVTI